MCMTPHGPDATTFERAVAIDSDAPEHLPRDTLAFMFEVPAQTHAVLRTTRAQHAF